MTRPQLLWAPASVTNSYAAANYAKLVDAAQTRQALNVDQVMTQRVQRIARRLIEQAHTFRPDAATWPWEVNVFETEQVNAYAMPGGKIAVMSGLIQSLALDDDEIAAAVGHEIAHALREHTRERVSQESLLRGLAQAAREADKKKAATAIDLVSEYGVLLPFSRDMEIEADVMGLELAARAGFNPAAAISLQHKLGGSKEASTAFFDTHPRSQDRVAAIQAALPKVQNLYAKSRALRPTPTAVVTQP